MKSPNHLLGGQVFTGLCCAMTNVNLFESPIYIGLTATMSLLPDIDLPKSIIGRTCRPISRWINRRYGHRTLTHSVPALMAITVAMAVLDHTLLQIGYLATIAFFAYLSHLIFDMMTLQGVPLLYPFTKNPFVIPGNPSFRIHTGDRRAETIVFCSFLLLAILLRPLFHHGFWTSYNRLFGTLEHLAREYRRSDNLLLVSYRIRKGSELLTGEGYCIEAEDTRAVLIENGRFRIIDTDEYVVEEVIPEPTDKRFFYHRESFTQISADSLNRLLADKLITEIEVHSDEPFVTHWRETPPNSWREAPPRAIFNQTQQQTFRQQFLETISFIQERDSLIAEPGGGIFVYDPNPRIPILRQRLASLRQENQLKARKWEEHRQYLRRLQDELAQTTNVIRREQLFDLLQEARKVKPPSIDYAKELELETEIRELQRDEILRNEERRLKAAEPAPDKQHGWGLTGWASWIEIKLSTDLLQNK